MNTTYNNQKYLFIVLVIFSIVLGVFLRFYLFNKDVKDYPIGLDGEYQFYHLTNYVINKEFPIEGVFLNSPDYYYDDSNARIPGGYFYTSYLIKYFLGGASYRGAIFVNLVVSIIAGFSFIYWTFKRFSFSTASIISALIFMNVYYINVSMSIYNPNNPLLLSFLFIPLLYEYLYNQKGSIYAIFLFPVLALMAQCHFSNFFSLIPTLIIFLIIKYNKYTKKSLVQLAIGVFISFLLYVPYLIYQINNNFVGLKKILSRKGEIDVINIIQPPQIYSIMLFPTNERGGKYVNGIKDILRLYFNENYFNIYSFLFYIASILLSLFILIYVYKQFFRKKIITNDDKKTSVFYDLLFFYLLYIITSIVFFMLANIGSGRPHYFYSSFTLAFIPFIYFLEYLNMKNMNRVLLLISIYSFFNIFSIFLFRLH